MHPNHRKSKKKKNWVNTESKLLKLTKAQNRHQFDDNKKCVLTLRVLLILTKLPVPRKWKWWVNMGAFFPSNICKLISRFVNFVTGKYSRVLNLLSWYANELQYDKRLNPTFSRLRTYYFSVHLRIKKQSSIRYTKHVRRTILPQGLRITVYHLNGRLGL